MSTIHVKFRDESHDLDLSTLFPQDRLSALGVSDTNVSVTSFNDAQIKRAVADRLDVNENEFSSYTVERHENGNATIHPRAVFAS